MPPAGRLFGNIPPRPPEESLRDLIRSTPGEEGRWFAAAKEAGLLELAIEVADRSPADPRTLTHAARDFRDKNPAFAIGAGLAAVRWLGEGYGYEITGADVWAGLFSDKRGGRAARAARRDSRPDTKTVPATGCVADMLARELGLDARQGAAKKS